MHTTNYDTFSISQQYHSAWSCASTHHTDCAPLKSRPCSCTSASFRFCFITYFVSMGFFLSTSQYRTYFVLSSASCPGHHTPGISFETNVSSAYTSSPSPSPSSLLSLSLLFIIISSFLVFPIIKQFAGHTLSCVAEKQIPHEFIGGCRKEIRKILNCKIVAGCEALKRACCPVQSTDLVWPCNCCLPNNELLLDGDSSVENA